MESRQNYWVQLLSLPTEDRQRFMLAPAPVAHRLTFRGVNRKISIEEDDSSFECVMVIVLSLSLTELSAHTPHYEPVKLEVPNSWYMVSVSDLFLLNPKSELDDNMKVGFIPMALVEDGFSGNHFYEERTWKDVKRGYCHFQNGDIGIAKISPCFENRKSTIFKNLPNTYGAGTTELVILRPIKVYTKFYLYLFKSDWYVKEGTKYFKGVVGQQRVHKEIFTDLHIPLPPFAEQQRIVEEIEYWFALIDQIEQDKSDLQTAIRQTKSKILDLAIYGKLVLRQARSAKPE